MNANSQTSPYVFVRRPRQPSGATTQLLDGVARKVSAELNETVYWMTASSPLRSSIFLDTEWLATPPVLLGQYCFFATEHQSVGVVTWANVNAEVEVRLATGSQALRPDDWNSGDKLVLVSAISRLGSEEAMIADLKTYVFPDRDVWRLNG